MESNVATPCPAADLLVGRIKAEHRALARVIGAMQAWVARAREPGDPADRTLFTAMLRYVAEVPDRFHHPQEDSHLFPAMAALPGAGDVIATLEREHSAGAGLLAAVGEAFGALGEDAPNALNRLGTAVDEFAEFYWSHMRTEEEVLLPLALRGLPEDEWVRLDRAFETVKDPLFGAEPARGYQELYRFITERTPGPLRGYLQEASPARA